MIYITKCSVNQRFFFTRASCYQSRVAILVFLDFYNLPKRREIKCVSREESK
jgi:hypothetical protein